MIRKNMGTHKLRSSSDLCRSGLGMECDLSEEELIVVGVRE